MKSEQYQKLYLIENAYEYKMRIFNQLFDF